jgi:hypothetical protein
LKRNKKLTLEQTVETHFQLESKAEFQALEWHRFGLRCSLRHITYLIADLENKEPAKP